VEGVKHEYHEGPQTGENFKALAAAVFQAKRKAAPANSKKRMLRKISGNARLRLVVPLGCPCVRVAHAVCALASGFSLDHPLPGNRSMGEGTDSIGHSFVVRRMSPWKMAKYYAGKMLGAR
jgi:hypothetical protein